MSGPLRNSWAFPRSGADLIEALKIKEADLVKQIEDALDNDALNEKELEEYREVLRAAGVAGWETARLPDRNSYGSSRMDSSYYRTTASRLAKDLQECQLYRRALEKDSEINPKKLYKLHPTDTEWFGL